MGKSSPTRGKPRRGRPAGHGYTGTPEYMAWANMRSACNNPGIPKFKWYGAKGIGYCAAFDTFEGFLDAMGERPPGHRLARRNIRQDFTVENCFWLELKQR